MAMMKIALQIETEEGTYHLVSGETRFVSKLPEPPPIPSHPYADYQYNLLPFKQTYVQWGGLLIGTGTMAKYGCLVTTLASLLTWAGCKTDPGKVLEVLKAVLAFEGNYLSHPSRVENGYPEVVWYKDYHFPTDDPKHTSKIDWTDEPADMDLLQALLHNQPVPLQVDYYPVTNDIEPHFVLGVEYHPDPNGGLEDDLTIMDPISGTFTSVLTYFNPAWLGAWMIRNNVTKVARTLLGARVWEVQL